MIDRNEEIERELAAKLRTTIDSLSATGWPTRA
jgi:hypothetical protein